MTSTMTGFSAQGEVVALDKMELQGPIAATAFEVFGSANLDETMQPLEAVIRCCERFALVQVLLLFLSLNFLFFTRPLLQN